GTGGGGVVNSGPARIFDEYQVMIKLMTKTINTMLWMDNFRHGQPSGVGISDNRQFNINGLDESLNNGIDPSVYGNIYSTYGGQQRNGNIGTALNSTPLYLGTANGAPGQIDFATLMQLWSQCKVDGGNPT